MSPVRDNNSVISIKMFNIAGKKVDSVKMDDLRSLWATCL